MSNDMNNSVDNSVLPLSLKKEMQLQCKCVSIYFMKLEFYHSWFKSLRRQKYTIKRASLLHFCTFS